MSIQAVGWVLASSESTGSARLVLLSIANHCDAYGSEAWPSLETIAHEARVRSRNTVLAAIAQLEELGELLVYPGDGRRRRSPDAWQRTPTNRYELPLMPGWKAPPGLTPRRANPAHLDDPVVARSEDDSRAIQGSIVARSESIVARPIAREPSFDPSGEPSGEPSASASFERFWSSYPKRNGQRIGKANALRLWSKLKPVDRDEAIRMLPVYAKSAGDFPKDAERYLRHRLWEDLEERRFGSGMRSNVERLAERARQIGVDDGRR